MFPSRLGWTPRVRRVTSRAFSREGALLLLVGVALVGSSCEEKKAPTENAAPDASVGTDKYATADPKLARALQTTTSSAGAGDKGPPPDGFFPTGAADQRQPREMPT